MKPKISVIMSVFNEEKYLRKTIHSVLNQTYSNFEFIIVDDCSTDKTPTMLKEFAQKDKRIRLLKNKSNIGLTKSLNRALKIAVGTYIARQDASDWSSADRFSEQIRFLEKNTEFWVVGSDVAVVDAHGNRLRTITYSKYNKQLQQRQVGTHIVCHPASMFRRDKIQNIGGYDARYRYAQDLDLWLRILSRGGKIHSLPRILHNLRRGYPNAISSQYKRHQNICALKTRLVHVQHFFLHPPYLLSILHHITYLSTPPPLLHPIRKLRSIFVK